MACSAGGHGERRAARNLCWILTPRREIVPNWASRPARCPPESRNPEPHMQDHRKNCSSRQPTSPTEDYSITPRFTIPNNTNHGMHWPIEAPKEFVIATVKTGSTWTSTTAQCHPQTILGDESETRSNGRNGASLPEPTMKATRDHDGSLETEATATGRAAQPPRLSDSLTPTMMTLGFSEPKRAKSARAITTTLTSQLVVEQRS